MTLSGLPAAGGCFCAALMLAFIVDSDAGVGFERQRWVGALVAACAACAFAAMIGWATLRRGGLPAPVLLGILALAGVPFALPAGLFVPAAAVALVACAALATRGLARPPASRRGARRLTAGLAATALALAVGQALAVGLHDTANPARAELRASGAATKPAAAVPRRRVQRNRAPATQRPAPEPAPPVVAKVAPRPAAQIAPSAAPTAPPSGAERFVRDYYAALNGRRFVVAWRMLSPEVRSAFGGFARWRDGYALTVASTPGSLRVTPAHGGATVGLTLRAMDRDACGKTVVRRFSVTWHLASTEAGWRATAAAAQVLSGPVTAAAC